jgi:mannose-6-phosphate isomerase-like protein (cupin superfamily)
MSTALLFVGLGVSTAAIVIAGQPSTTAGGFSELHRARMPDAGDIEIVMGLIERTGESRSGKHHHPGGEFGFVLSGLIVVEAEDASSQTLEAGDSFYQPPGEWHVVSTKAAGAKTVVFRVIKKGEPMVVSLD